MFRAVLLTSVAVVALNSAVLAQSEVKDISQPERMPQAFVRTIEVIKDWFGPAAQASTPDSLDVQSIEPAAGTDDDVLQVPPPYTGPQSQLIRDRATAFDSDRFTAAFNDASPASAADMADIAPAAGDDAEVDVSKIDCDAVLKAAQSVEEGAEMPDTALVEACDTPTDATGEPVRAPAQPGFEDLPITQPAAGEPPIGNAVMPGEKKK
jgi:hypothetical protein